MAELQELYQTIIMDHNKRPRHYGALETFTHHAEGYNPICGDKIELRLNLIGELIEDIGFESACCAICKASTSMMVDVLQGKTLQHIGPLQTEVTGYLDGSTQAGNMDSVSSDLAALAGVSQFPARIKCAQLPWQTLQKALKPQS